MEHNILHGNYIRYTKIAGLRTSLHWTICLLFPQLSSAAVQSLLIAFRGNPTRTIEKREIMQFIISACFHSEQITNKYADCMCTRFKHRVHRNVQWRCVQDCTIWTFLKTFKIFSIVSGNIGCSAVQCRAAEKQSISSYVLVAFSYGINPQENICALLDQAWNSTYRNRFSERA